MYFSHAIAAVAAFAFLAAAAPATPAELGLKYQTRQSKRSPLVIQQSVEETTVTVIEQNTGSLSQIAQLAESELAALLQAQLAVVQELDLIKNNIRVNTFKSQFSNVNSVIITVTNIVDARDPNNLNKRYLVNQQLADNGSKQTIALMVTDVQTFTVNAQATASAGAAIGGLGLGGLGLSAASPTAVSQPTTAPQVAPLNAAAPFGALNASIILPLGTLAPTLALVVSDPAAIILPGSAGLFVENRNNILTDCALFAASGTTLGSNVQQYSSLQALQAAELLGIVLAGSPQQSSAANQATAGATPPASTSAAATAAASTTRAVAAGAASQPTQAPSSATRGSGVQTVPVA